MANPFTKQSSILGLPIGPSQPAWGRIAGAVLGALGGVGVLGVGTSLKEKFDNLKQKFSGPLADGKAILHGGEEVMHDASDLMHEASDIGHKFANVGKALSGGGGMFSKIKNVVQALRGGGGGSEYTKKLRLIIKLAQDVGVPRTVAYNQWTQLEDFPEFMKGVESVELEPPESEDGDGEEEGGNGENGEEEDEGNIQYSNWTVKIGFTRRQFKAEVTEAIPDERIVWKSTQGPNHQGVVTFASFDANLTRVQVEMEYIPSGFVEKVGNIFLAARRKARKDLRLYKHYIELKGEETGAWRGEIRGEEEEEGSEEDGQPQGGEDAEDAQGEAAEERAEPATSGS